jgi:hypothetical protein
VIAKNQKVFRQYDVADDSGQKVVRKILHRVEENGQDAFDNMTTLAPGHLFTANNISSVLVAFILGNSHTPRSWPLEQDLATSETGGHVTFRTVGGRTILFFTSYL